MCGLSDERGLRAAMKGVDVIYHLVGTERQGSRADLSGVDVDGTRTLADVAAKAGVERVFYLSHLGADRASAYPVLKAKAIAEHHLMNSGVNYTIFRPGVIYGPGDQFTTAIANLIRLTPGIFLLPGDGKTLIQPIGVEDVVACLGWALDDETTANKTFALGGVDTISFRQAVETVMNVTRQRRTIIEISPAYLRMLAVWMDHSYKTFPLSLYWLDYLSADRTCPVDTLPRLFGLMPARFHQNLDYLAPQPRRVRGAWRRA